MSFVKLDAGILNSTIWVLRPELELFVTALLMATPVQFEEPVPTIKIRTLDDDEFVIPPGWYGMVEAAGPGLINRAHVDLEKGLVALERLASPEPESRSQEFEGRRMVRINGGYVVLNFMRYRDKDHTAAERQRRLRARKKVTKSTEMKRDGHAVTRDVTLLRRNVTQSEDRGQRTETDTGDHIQSPDPANAAAPPAGMDEELALAASMPEAAAVVETVTIDAIYQAYPRKKQPALAKKAIANAIKALKACGKPPEWLLDRVSMYSAAVERWPAAERCYVPYPASWFNAASFDEDPAEWRRDDVADKPRRFENIPGGHPPSAPLMR